VTDEEYLAQLDAELDEYLEQQADTPTVYIVTLYAVIVWTAAVYALAAVTVWRWLR
jgi:hypothetical protein